MRKTTFSTFTQAQEAAMHIVDKLGNPIDGVIIEIVAALWIHGVNTVGSCEGHLGCFTGGPYVMFESLDVERYKAKYKNVTDQTSPEYKHWYNQAAYVNTLEVQKVLLLLDEFYDKRISHNSQRIIVRCFDTVDGKLMCQGADIARVLSTEEQEDLLRENQKEMSSFTQFLREKAARKT